jgi:mono/diheme cytochrome c family protein
MSSQRVSGGKSSAKFLTAVALVCVLSPAAAQQSGAAGASSGEAVYEYWCATCHSAGPNMPGTAALQVKYSGNPPAVLIERPDLTREFIAAIVRSGISVMPPFRKTEITDAELAALTAYIVTTARENASD